jgi:hypothetical protein
MVVKVAVAVEATGCFHINTDSATVAYNIQYRCIQSPPLPARNQQHRDNYREAPCSKVGGPII